jgi:hypothetical protein
LHFFLTDPGAIGALFQVSLIDLVLAGDNAVVIGLAAAGLAHHLRGRAILIGIGAATLLRIVFALLAMQILAIAGLLLAGGILLLWICWKMWRETRAHAMASAPVYADGGGGGHGTGVGGVPLKRAKTLGQAVADGQHDSLLERDGLVRDIDKECCNQSRLSDHIFLIDIRPATPHLSWAAPRLSEDCQAGPLWQPRERLRCRTGCPMIRTGSA